MTQLEMFSKTLSRNPDCTACRLHKTAKTVCLLGHGPTRTDVMIVGEAPGRTEDEGGKPFIGQAGRLLDEALEEAGVDRRKAFVCNAVSCRPPDNRTPSKGEVKACRQWLDHQMSVVKPKFVLLLGNTPLLSVTGSSGIKKARGRPFEKDGVVYLPTYHPAFILRDPTERGLFDRDLRLFAEIIASGGIPRETNLKSRLVLTWDDVEDMVADLRGAVSFDIETSCLYPWQIRNEKGKLDPAKVTMIGFGTARAQWSVPFNQPSSPWSDDDAREIVSLITPRLEDCYVIAHNGKFDFLWMWVHYGVKWYEYYDFDTMYAHYLLDENDRHGLKYLAQKFLGAPDWDVDADTKKGKASLDKQAVYHAHDLYYTRQLYRYFRKRLREDGYVERLFEHLMMPVARLFVEVEYDGIFIDTTKHEAASKYLHDEFDKATKELAKWSSINWASTKQLREFLFGSKKEGNLGLTPLDKTQKGTPSCNESVLKRLDHPCIAALLKFREAKQQLSFFIEGWKPFFHTTRRGTFLHPSFKLHGTVTGRPSCEHPNLQQVPRDERIRSLISAPEGWVLVDADLSQIELRIAAELANEPELLRIFHKEGDPHWTTAIREIGRGGGKKDEVINTAHAFLLRTDKRAKAPRYSDALEILLEMGADTAIEIDKGWKELRKKAKAVNFGYLYGMWWKKFKIYARDNYGVTVTDKEAEASRTGYFELYSAFPKWHAKQKRYARQNGYVRTLTGRKRRLPKAQSTEDTPERAAAERQAINSPVQGFAAELNLMVALQIREEFGRHQVRIVGTVHDAILFWVKKPLVRRVVTRIREVMRRPDLFDVFEIDLKVPVEGEAVVGPWGAGKSLEKWEAENVQGKSVQGEDVEKVPSRIPPEVRREAASKQSREAVGVRAARSRNDRSSRGGRGSQSGPRSHRLEGAKALSRRA